MKKFLFLILILTSPCLSQELSPYDMNGDGYINAQDINGFTQALHDGSNYITVQDITPFLELISQAKPELSIIAHTGMVYYLSKDLAQYDGLDPDKAYIVCHKYDIIEDIEYVFIDNGTMLSVSQLCSDMGYARSDVIIIITPQ